MPPIPDTGDLERDFPYWLRSAVGDWAIQHWIDRLLGDRPSEFPGEGMSSLWIDAGAFIYRYCGEDGLQLYADRLQTSPYQSRYRDIEIRAREAGRRRAATMRRYYKDRGS